MVQFPIIASLLSIAGSILAFQEMQPTTVPAELIDSAAVYPLPADQGAATMFHDWKSFMGKIDDYVKSILNRLGSHESPAVGSSIPNILQGFPTGREIVQAVGASDHEVAELTVHVLNLPCGFPKLRARIPGVQTLC